MHSFSQQWSSCAFWQQQQMRHARECINELFLNNNELISLIYSSASNLHDRRKEGVNRRQDMLGAGMLPTLTWIEISLIASKVHWFDDWSRINRKRLRWWNSSPRIHLFSQPICMVVPSSLAIHTIIQCEYDNTSISRTVQCNTRTARRVLIFAWLLTTIISNDLQQTQRMLWQQSYPGWRCVQVFGDNLFTESPNNADRE